MDTGHCRHDWVKRSQTLGEAFPVHAGCQREFRVCTRCLRIEELASRALAVEFPTPVPAAAPAATEGGLAAADELAA